MRPTTIYFMDIFGFATTAVNGEYIRSKRLACSEMCSRNWIVLFGALALTQQIAVYCSGPLSMSGVFDLFSISPLIM